MFPIDTITIKLCRGFFVWISVVCVQGLISLIVLPAQLIADHKYDHKEFVFYVL